MHRVLSNQLSGIIKEARFSNENNIANSKDTKQLYKHIRTQLSGADRSLQVKDSTGTNGTIANDENKFAEVFAETFSKVFIKGRFTLWDFS